MAFSWRVSGSLTIPFCTRSDLAKKRTQRLEAHVIRDCGLSSHTDTNHSGIYFSLDFLAIMAQRQLTHIPATSVEGQTSGSNIPIFQIGRCRLVDSKLRNRVDSDLTASSVCGMGILFVLGAFLMVFAVDPYGLFTKRTFVLYN
jgi:hypothetical protein